MKLAAIKKCCVAERAEAIMERVRGLARLPLAGMAQDTCNKCLNQPIPDDIARKLGIKPKERADV